MTRIRKGEQPPTLNRSEVGYEPLPRLDAKAVYLLLPSMKVLSEGGMSRVYAVRWFGSAAVLKALKPPKAQRHLSPLPPSSMCSKIEPENFHGGIVDLVDVSAVDKLPPRPRRGKAPDLVADLRREANMARDIARAGVKCCVPVAYGWEEMEPSGTVFAFLVFEHLQLGSLDVLATRVDSKIYKGMPLTMDEVAMWDHTRLYPRRLLNMFGIVDRLKQHGLLHRDLKDANMALDTTDGSIVLLDCGLACTMDDIHQQRVSLGAGTHVFMADSCRRGLAVDQEYRDYFSLFAVVLKDLLVRNAAFPPKSRAELVHVPVRELRVMGTDWLAAGVGKQPEGADIGVHMFRSMGSPRLTPLGGLMLWLMGCLGTIEDGSHLRPTVQQSRQMLEHYALLSGVLQIAYSEISACSSMSGSRDGSSTGSTPREEGTGGNRGGAGLAPMLGASALEAVSHLKDWLVIARPIVERHKYYVRSYGFADFCPTRTLELIHSLPDPLVQMAMDVIQPPQETWSGRLKQLEQQCGVMRMQQPPPALPSATAEPQAVNNDEYGNGGSDGRHRAMAEAVDEDDAVAPAAAVAVAAVQQQREASTRMAVGAVPAAAGHNKAAGSGRRRPLQDLNGRSARQQRQPSQTKEHQADGRAAKAVKVLPSAAAGQGQQAPDAQQAAAAPRAPAGGAPMAVAGRRAMRATAKSRSMR